MKSGFLDSGGRGDRRKEDKTNETNVSNSDAIGMDSGNSTTPVVGIEQFRCLSAAIGRQNKSASSSSSLRMNTLNVGIDGLDKHDDRC